MLQAILPRLITAFLLGAIATLGQSTQAREVRAGSGIRYPSSPSNETRLTINDLSERRLQCIFNLSRNNRSMDHHFNKTTDPHTPEISENAAREAGTSFSKAFEMFTKRRPEFLDNLSKTSLLQLFNYVVEESGAGTAMVERGQRSFSKTGFGYIQITGPGNLKIVESCMNKLEPGYGLGVSTNPAQVFRDTKKAAVASLCFWDHYFIQNPKQKAIADSADDLAGTEKVLRLMNSGSVTGFVMDRATGKFTKNADREADRRFKTYKALKAMEQTGCQGDFMKDSA